jgi:hypothetical protein
MRLMSHQSYQTNTAPIIYNKAIAPSTAAKAGTIELEPKLEAPFAGTMGEVVGLPPVPVLVAVMMPVEPTAPVPVPTGAVKVLV